MCASRLDVPGLEADKASQWGGVAKRGARAISKLAHHSPKSLIPVAVVCAIRDGEHLGPDLDRGFLMDGIRGVRRHADPPATVLSFVNNETTTSVKNPRGIVTIPGWLKGTIASLAGRP